MMIHYSQYTTTNLDGGMTRKNKKYYSNIIFTFDIETTSYAVDEDGIVHKPQIDMPLEWKKQDLVYHWQFSINECVYYGRTLQEFKVFLKAIRKDIKGIPIIFIHNLSFESQHLFNIFIDDIDLFARKERHPMKMYIHDLDIEFRCSYILFNMSLDGVAKNYKLPHQKSKDLDYTKFRTPNTPLTELEQSYCELDCLILYDAISMKVKEYGSVAKIPLTHTGEVREKVKDLYKGQQGMHYYKKLWKMVSQNYEEYYILRQCFQGGYTHANAINTNELLNNVSSYDISSSYPTQLVLKKFPMSRFYKSNVRNFDDMRDGYAYIFRIKFYDIESVGWNNYLSVLHSISIKDGIYDNGRVQRAEEYELWCTNVDLDIIRKSYSFKGYEISSAYISKLDYLDERFVNYILELYGNKTSMKGIPELYDLYMSSKQYINSLYGMCVTDTIRDDVIYNDGEWSVLPLTPEEITQKLKAQQRWGGTFLSYAWGVWCTAYARHQLWDAILELDDQVVYCDTDSVKYLGQTDFFEKYNENILAQHKKVSTERGIPLEKFSPLDPKGNSHPIGIFDYEGCYDEFKTLGAKRYCYLEKGELHITIAGVSKAKGVGVLSCVDDFKEGLYFDAEHSGKQIAFYNDNQEECTLYDYNGVPYECTDRFGICLAPTTYTLSMSPQYIDFLMSLQLIDSTRISIFEEVDFGKDIY